MLHGREDRRRNYVGSYRARVLPFLETNGIGCAHLGNDVTSPALPLPKLLSGCRSSIPNEASELRDMVTNIGGAGVKPLRHRKEVFELAIRDLIIDPNRQYRSPEMGCAFDFTRNVIRMIRALRKDQQEQSRVLYRTNDRTRMVLTWTNISARQPAAYSRSL